MNQQRMQKHPLLSRFDQDAGPWRPMMYPLEIPVPIAADQSENGSLTINNQPFIWTRLAHQIMGNTGDPETSGLYQDGQYDIAFKDEQSNYQKISFPAGATLGGPGQGYEVELPFPIPFAGSKTITFTITNRYARVLTPEPAEPVFPVKLVVIGVADWGELLS